MTPNATVHHSANEQETEALGAELVRRLPPGSVFALEGDLGAGKTCLVRGLAHALGITQPVTSPTFAIVNSYQGTHATLVHMDLYRLSGPDEALDMGFDEYLTPDAYVCIEWPSRAEELLPDHAYHITIQYGTAPETRTITIRPPANEVEG